MDEEELVTVYQELVEILNELGLKEIVQEVSSTIQRGKTSAKYAKGTQSPQLVVEAYTQQEQLSLLIDAIERTLVETAEMEYEISGFLQNQNLEPKIIRYLDANRDIIHDYREDIVYPKRQNARELKAMLEELRETYLSCVN